MQYAFGSLRVVFFKNNKYSVYKNKTSVPASSMHPHIRVGARSHEPFPVVAPGARLQLRGVLSWLQQLLPARRELGSPVPVVAHPGSVASCMGRGEPCFPPGLVPCSYSSIPLQGQDREQDPSPWLRGSPAQPWQSAGRISGLTLDPSEFSPSSELTHFLPISGVS